MNLSKVKTYIILLLAAANIISAALFGWKYYSAYTIDRQAELELMELLAGRGIIVTELPDDTEKRYILERSHSAEGNAAFALLGNCEIQDLGGGIYRYQGQNGSAQFRSGGRFEITLEGGETYQERADACRRIMTNMGMVGFTRDYIESDTQLIFGQEVNKRPVYNVKAIFEFDGDGRLVSVSGLWMFSGVMTAESAYCKSAGPVLLLLPELNGITVDKMQMGFRMNPAAPEASLLTPEWRVISGAEEMYIDAFSATVIQQE